MKVIDVIFYAVLALVVICLFKYAVAYFTIGFICWIIICCLVQFVSNSMIRGYAKNPFTVVLLWPVAMFNIIKSCV